MNAYFLYKQDGTKTDLSCCGVCGQLARGETNFDISEKCCTCYDCGEPLGADKTASNTLYHHECERQRRHAAERRRLDKAVLVDGYDGPVYFEGGHGSYGEAYYENVDELSEDDAFPEDEEFAFCCEASGVAMDLSSILENLTEEMFEDAIDHLYGTEELAKAVDAFNAENVSVVTWNVDYKRKVRVREISKTEVISDESQESQL
jgi:hypothetical protein